MNTKKILKNSVIILLLVILFGCGQENQKYIDELEIGKNAMLNNEYEVAVEAFSNALIIKPDDPDALLLLNNANVKTEEMKRQLEFLELKRELAQYVIKINELQDLFVQSFDSKQRANDLHLLTIRADFSPPQQIYEIHKIYISFLKEWSRSEDLYEQGNVKEATEALKNTDGIFSEYNIKFGYFLDDKGIEFKEVGYSGRFGY